MASFSFGAGNAAKLLRLPLYATGRLITLVVPRGERWVFGCDVGIADGALELWRVAAADGVHGVWLVADEAQRRDAERLGIRAVRKGSVRGFWQTARAGVIVVTHGFGDVNPYGVSGAFVVQLWHGIPLKRIGLDSPVTTRSAILPGSRLLRRLLRLLYRAAQRRIDVIPAASHLVRGRLQSAFGLPDERVVVTGEPRVDPLSAGSPRERRAAALSTLEGALGRIEPDTRLVLYAPTWRDGAPDPAVPDREQWRRIGELLRERDATLLVRSHRLGAGGYRTQTERVRMLGADVLADVTGVLPGLDALVTDYSSLAYDAGLVPLPVLYLAPDERDYAMSRGFYGDYREVAGEPATSWDELLPRLDSLLGDERVRARLTAASAELSSTVHAYRDGHNASRVYRAIAARTGRREGDGR